MPVPSTQANPNTPGGRSTSPMNIPAPVQASPSSTPATPRHRRRKTAENWDDDFEFALPTKSAKKPEGRKEGTDTWTGTGPSKGEVSSGSSWEESWDESPPGPSRHSPTQDRRISSRIPSAISIPHLPRSSSSQASSLPSPGARLPPASKTDSTFGEAASTENGDAIASKDRPRSGSSTKSKLVKRHPSSSVISPPSVPQPLDRSRLPASPPISNHDRPNSITSPRPLPRSDSGERMPPPPVPSMPGRSRSNSKGKARADSRQEVRVSRIPFSPSIEQINTVESRRPSFWKRLSGAPPASPAIAIEAESTRLRRRSSSASGKRPTDLPSPRPPVPPIPPNMRSSSSNSTSSNISASSSNRSGPSTLSAILRRSASNLTKRSAPPTPPQSAYSFSAHMARLSTTSVNSIPPTPSLPIPLPARANPSPTLPSSHSFSRGFHLPSPSPNSPYHASTSSSVASTIPHSVSFTGSTKNDLRRDDSDTDNDTETEQDAKTPRRRRKIRPVSAMPSAVNPNGGWPGDGWRGFDGQGPPPFLAETRRTKSGGSTSDMASPSLRAGTFAANTASSFRRLGSFSKKHGRRLSGGIMFGTTSSSSSHESRRSSVALETVMGSPSKPSRAAQDSHPGDGRDRDHRGGSVFAPSSSFKPPPASEAMVSSLSEDAIAKKAAKQRRRQSWNDFVIPRSVLDKQKGLKENIGAVKMFAVGLDSLKDLLDMHAKLHRDIEAYSPSAQKKIDMFKELDAEFGQWWEMATVLIEVGNTSTGSNRNSMDSAPPASPRSRPITVAAEQGRSASSILPSVPLTKSSMSTSDSFTSRSISLPDPADLASPKNGSPPRASPETWRASTGRQELSKRQLEVLRTMLRTPVADRPDPMSRQASTLSASSTQVSVRPGVAATISPVLSTSSTRQTSGSTTSSSTSPGIRLPSPPDSAYIIASTSFPSPGTASTLANPKRSSKAGLAGLKDFLRSLKTGRASSAVSSANVQTDGRAVRPGVFRRPTFSPPTSPSLPVFSHFNALPHPSGSQPPPSPSMSNNADGPTRPQSAKRPSLRNIFRSSSGNWSDLVRSERKSIDGGRENTAVPNYQGQVGEETTRVEVSGLPRLSSRISLNRSNSQSSKHRHQHQHRQHPPKSPKRTKSTKGTKVSQGDAFASQAGVADTAADDRTLRPRKSRVIGLGWPEQEVQQREQRISHDGHEARGDDTSPSVPVASAQGVSQIVSRDSTKSSTHVEGCRSSDKVNDNDMDELTPLMLTPENLPVLLEYLRTCERMLGEWRVKATVAGLLDA